MRKLATAAFSFAAATFLSLFIVPDGWLPLCCAAAAAASLAGFLFRNSIRLRFFLILLSLSAGFLWSYAYTAIFVMPSMDLHNETRTVTAVIKSRPSSTGRGYRADCVVRRVSAPDIGARIYYYNETTLNPGDVIEFTARFRYTGGIEDDERIDALSSRGAFLAAYVSGDVTVTGKGSVVRYFPQRLAAAIGDMSGRLFPERAAPFMKALLTGDRGQLSQDAALTAAMSSSGIAHVVSVSGMHVSFLMGFLALIVKNKRRFAIAGIPVLVLFMAMTGFTPSVTRAGIMQIFLVCAPVFRRERDGITSLSAALLVLLMINPYSCASVSLQLSFAATLGIILFTARINSGVRDSLRATSLYRSKPGKPVLNFVISNLATTVGALIFTIPLMALHFGYVSIIAPLTNLLTMWAVSIAFPLGLAACALGFIFLPLGTVVAFPVTLAVSFIILVAQGLAAVPFSVVYSSNSPLLFWLGYVYVMFITLPLMKARARQYIYPACAAAVLLFIILLVSRSYPGVADSSVNALEVGQGQSIVFCDGGYTAVVDCGSSSGEDAGAVTHEFLQNLGRTSIDLLVLTHFHADHVNGVESLISMMSVSALATPDPEGFYLAEDIIELARKRGTDIIYVTEAYSVSLGELSFILYPPVGDGGENERCLSVLSLGSVRTLITGDMNASCERSLLRYADLPDIDVLISGHHGSRFSTSEELLAAVTPEIAIISVGRNSYGHPSDETLMRLEQRNIRVFRTDHLGHVTVSG